MRNHTYVSPINERMDVSFFNYFSTVTLGLMCYSFFNPGFIFDMSMFLAYGFAKTMITGCDVYSKYIYTPYRKHIKKPLMEILNIDDGLYEIEIVKNGRVIHKYKTMSDFIKYNPIKFINEDNEDSESESETETETGICSKKIESDIKVETPVDADLTHENIDIHDQEESNKNSDGDGDGDGDGDNDGKDEGEEDDDDNGEVDTDDTKDTTHTDDANYDNLILEPSEYDFILRNIYFEDDTSNTSFGYCLKYETFRKSDIRPKNYTYEEMKNMVSKRRFIGIHLNTENKDYIINLTNPVNYYLVNNTILDYSFLKMYLFNRYNVTLGNTYKLSCIDNFIEMYTVEQGKKFFVKENTFKLVDDETYKFDEDEDEDEDEDDDAPIVSEHEENDTSKSTQDTGEALTEADIEIVECNYNS
jgi:hypothetical protein